MKSYNHIKNIFFDLDHTLWDFDKNSELAFKNIFKKFHPTIDLIEFLKIYIPINQACWKLYQKDLITHSELKYKRLRDTFEELNYSISDADIDLLSATFLEELPKYNALFEGTIEILEYLKSKYQLHIITNGFAKVQERKIENSGLKPYFKTITNSEMAGVKKPNPIIYQHALNLAKAEKQNSIMIGDCLDADVNGALSFGMDAIFFNPNQQVVENKIVTITNLFDLKSWF